MCTTYTTTYTDPQTRIGAGPGRPLLALKVMKAEAINLTSKELRL